MPLSKDQRRALHLYAYSGVDNSLVSRFILNPFWNVLVKAFPLSVAPNMITLMGFAFVLANLSLLLYYSPDLVEPCPNWVYTSFAIGLFIYQSFDAIDGKQARRTGTSGPLGELFDHCCDALNTTVVTILGGSALNLHQSWWFVVSMISTLSNFYLSTWEEYHTGTLYLSYCSGPVEGILVGVLVFALAGMYSPAFFETTVHHILHKQLHFSHEFLQNFPDMPLNFFFLAFGSIFCLFNIFASCYNVSQSRGTERAHKDPSMVMPVVRLMPMFFFFALLLVWVSVSPTILHHHMVPLALGFGLVFGYQVGSMILAHLTKSAFPLYTWPVNVLLPVGALGSFLLGEYHRGSLDVLVAGLHLPAATAPALETGIQTWAALVGTVLTALKQTRYVATALWAGKPPSLVASLVGKVAPVTPSLVQVEGAWVAVFLVVSALAYAVWARRTIRDICEELDIWCLRIKHKKAPGAKKTK